MTAQSVAIGPITASPGRGGMFLGFGNSLRKELTQWMRGPGALIIAGISILGAVFMTLIPFIAKATNESEAAGMTSMDPTANVLLVFAGQTIAFIVVVATMALLSGERDRGTLAWSLTNPVSPTSIIAAKYVAAMLVISVTAVVLPLVVSVGVATVAYGGLPNLAIVGTYAGLYLMVPAFFIALTVGFGTAIRSTAGVAGAAFAVVFVPQILGGILPIVNELSPTSIGNWALAVAKGQPASPLTLVGWVVSMVVIVIAAKLVFDRQEV
jgi:ABC-type transport system involved in multi-copper enzyme maturation permease subunit